MKFACSLAIAVGMITFSLSIYGKIANVAYEAALGVFFIVIGLLGFMSLELQNWKKR